MRFGLVDLAMAIMLAIQLVVVTIAQICILM